MNAHPSPEKIVQISSGGWTCAVLGSAVTFGLFNHLEGEGASTAELRKKIPISDRGLQALLDGLTGMGLLQLQEGKYRNSPEASMYLVEGKPTYMGGFAQINLQDLKRWADFPKVVKTGVPLDENTAELPESKYWEWLVPSIATLSMPLVHRSGESLKIPTAGPVTWLDVGGGSGIYSAIWLKMNPQAQAYQLDWPNVNQIARKYVGSYGVEDRFHTLDGDFHVADFGQSKYDFAIYSHIAHQESPASNAEIFRKFRAALKPGGTLLISDFILNDDRSGHPFAMNFYAMMVLHTKAGATYRKGDYEAWLKEAEFKDIVFESNETPATLIYAK